MAPIAARKARQILENVQKIVAIELLYAAQAFDLKLNHEKQRDDTRAEKLFGKGTAAAYQVIRRRVPFLEKDRPLYRDIETMRQLVKSGELLTAVEKIVGELN
jgi:histidine ammonia-lyase